MKKIFTVLMMITSMNLLASAQTCIDKITHDNSVDSASITFQAEDYEFENDHVGDAYQLSRLFVERKGCGKKDLRFTGGPDSGRSGKAICKLIAKGIPHSRVCYIESNIGFFIVSRDMVSGATVVYNRWD
jgi:hypothetical protein